MTITLHTAVQAARNDGPDPKVTALLAQLDQTVTDLRAAMRIGCPANLHVDAVTDSRLTVIGLLVAEMRGRPTYTPPMPDVDDDVPAPTLYALTAAELAAVKNAEFVRGHDAGWAAAGGDGDLEVETP